MFEYCDLKNVQAPTQRPAFPLPPGNVYSY
jgi:hypothetical protein